MRQSEEECEQTGCISQFHQQDHTESLFLQACNKGVSLAMGWGYWKGKWWHVHHPARVSPFLTTVHPLCFLYMGGQEKDYHIFIFSYIYIFIWTCVCACLCVCTYVYVYIHIYKYTVQLYDLTELDSAAALFGKLSSQIYLHWHV